MPEQKIRTTLERIFDDNPRAIERCATAAGLNGLFAWAPIEGMRRVKAFILMAGLDTIWAERRTNAETGILLGVSTQTAGASYTDVVAGLRNGYRLIEGAPDSVLLKNPFREIGIPAQAWRPIARHGIFTLETLCHLGEAKISGIDGVGRSSLGLIKQLLPAGFQLSP